MKMNVKVFTVFAILCVLRASAFLDFGAESKDLSILKTCTKDKKCASFCLAKQLNFSSENGEINTSKIPFYENLKSLGLEKCITDATRETDGCKKFNSIHKCLATSGMKTLSEYSNNCTQESKIGEFKFDFINIMKLVTNPNSFKCYIRCMLVKFGVLNADNTMKLDGFDKMMTGKGFKVHNVVGIVKKCQEMHGNKGDECLVLSNIVSCVGKEAVSKLGLSNLKQFKSFAGL